MNKYSYKIEENKSPKKPNMISKKISVLGLLRSCLKCSNDHMTFEVVSLYVTVILVRCSCEEVWIRKNKYAAVKKNLVHVKIFFVRDLEKYNIYLEP